MIADLLDAGSSFFRTSSKGTQCVESGFQRFAINCM
jgi:hypothetical protein